MENYFERYLKIPLPDDLSKEEMDSFFSALYKIFPEIEIITVAEKISAEKAIKLWLDRGVRYRKFDYDEALRIYTVKYDNGTISHKVNCVDVMNLKTLDEAKALFTPRK